MASSKRIGYSAAVRKIENEEKMTGVSGSIKIYNELSDKIWRNPEIKFEEKFAHDILSGILEGNDFDVTRNYILPTAFKAEYKNGAIDSETTTVAVICEYDALPEIGHACGHNLIAEAGLAAGIGIKDALEADADINGRIIVLGTPAEEGGNGKVKMLRKGAFDDVDVAIMVHPTCSNHLFPPLIGVVRGNAKFRGKAAHASGFPWEGVNALDAAVSAYNSLAYLRQHIKPSTRINVIITKGGAAPNIIPDDSELSFYIRAAKSSDLDELCKKVKKCFESAAESTGCTLEYNLMENYGPNNLIVNRKMAEIYKKNSEKYGVVFNDGDANVISFMASTDFGSVSHAVPSIHPTYSISKTAVNHSLEFTEAAGSPEAQKPTLIAAKSLALTALDIMCDRHLLDDIKRQFKIDLDDDRK